MGFLGAATSAILCIARTNHCERVLRIEVVVHNTQELQCVRSLEKFPQIALQAKVILERFMDALSCIDQCFISDSMLEQLPPPSWVGKTKVGGIDLNKPRMRSVIEAVIALCLSLSPHGFTASELARSGPAAQQPRRIGVWRSLRRL
jgi:hypothetical protein